MASLSSDSEFTNSNLPTSYRFIKELNDLIIDHQGVICHNFQMNESNWCWVKDESCGICRQGRRLLMRNLDSNQIFLMCEECESCWDDPKNLDYKLAHNIVSSKGIVHVSCEEMSDHAWFFLLIK